MHHACMCEEFSEIELRERFSFWMSVKRWKWKIYHQNRGNSCTYLWRELYLIEAKNICNPITLLKDIWFKRLFFKIAPECVYLICTVTKLQHRSLLILWLITSVDNFLAYTVIYICIFWISIYLYCYFFSLDFWTSALCSAVCFHSNSCKCFKCHCHILTSLNALMTCCRYWEGDCIIAIGGVLNDEICEY